MTGSQPIFAGMAALLVLTGCTSAFVGQQDADLANLEIDYDLIHSDIPLFTTEEDELWPQSFVSDDSFGCTSIVRSGDWRFNLVDTYDPEWMRLENYGVMHCWLNYWSDYQRGELGVADPRPAFFIHAADVEIEGVAIELWAIQIGARPGSDYVLLSRSPTDDANSYVVLQKACPRSAIRKAGYLSVLRTDYCAINSKQELIELMKDMAELPPAGRLTFVGESEN
ncbi:MAG: hypothetical protein CMK07_16280 [Ponticaulis sp.]|nr:hypothetical protein [Ponticaulis sp.]